MEREALGHLSLFWFHSLLPNCAFNVLFWEKKYLCILFWPVLCKSVQLKMGPFCISSHLYLCTLRKNVSELRIFTIIEFNQIMVVIRIYWTIYVYFAQVLSTVIPCIIKKKDYNHFAENILIFCINTVFVCWFQRKDSPYSPQRYM